MIKTKRLKNLKLLKQKKLNKLINLRSKQDSLLHNDIETRKTWKMMNEWVYG